MPKTKSRKQSPVPEISPSNARHQKWVSRAYGFAAACLFGLAVAEVSGMATTLVRTLAMIGIGASGTVAWVMQAKRECPNCGRLYGYAIRIVNANVCRYCGTEFPKWMPGQEDGTNKTG
ncbi:MAG: hypothetical protein AAGF14_05820 [Pseudomonadota bacterium]